MVASRAAFARPAAGNDLPKASASSAGQSRVWWPHRPEDREVERKVAQRGVDAGIVAPPPVPFKSTAAEGSHAPADFETARDGEIAAAADAVLTEYLLMQRLSEEFPGTEFVPYGYPVEKLRLEVAQQVAGLSPADRQELLEQVPGALRQEGPGQPVMSHPRSGVIYEGPDAENPEPGGIPIDRDPQSVEK
jgi:hypothetical protein